ncbi:hypothetical protein CB1_000159033 [Camelus ferus]|nr:hypothetical protein CB1_000159033 [Camelus ferus]
MPQSTLTFGNISKSFLVTILDIQQKFVKLQTWLGQELEKCGIDAMIYTRYVLSLLLHDSYDYDLQEQENDIFLGWEKGAYKKWGKSKKKCSDLTLEEMKKQAAVQCLRSASDEVCAEANALFMTLKVRLSHLFTSSGIETLVEELCSRLKDLQSKQAPPASTDTSSPKDCNSEGEAAKERRSDVPTTVHEKAQSKSHSEKEATFRDGTGAEKPALYRKQTRHKPEGKGRPRSWSSGSSEAGSSSSGNQGEPKASVKCVKVRHKTREIRNRKGRNGQSRLSLKHGEKAERSLQAGGGSSSSSGSVKQLCRRGRRPLKEPGRRDTGSTEGRDLCAESRNDREYKEEPLWYTEPIAEYFVPLSRKSKLETTYRNRQDTSDLTSEAVDELSESVHGLCISNNNIHKTYLAAEDNRYLDDIHLSELTHFYEKSKEKTDFEAECCIVLDGMELQGERAIWTDSTSSVGAEGFFLQDLGNLAQFWECCSSSSGDADGESFGGDSPIRLSPILDSTALMFEVQCKETRSDNETLNIQFEESTQFNADDINYLEQKPENKTFETTHVCSESSPHGDGYSSGVIKDIWTKMADRNSVATVETERIDDELFSTDVNNYCCCLDAEAEVEPLQEPSKAVQRSEYHLWEGQKENLEKGAFVSGELSKVDGGDYTTPSKPWDVAQDKENSFILGGVYGELKSFNSDGEWAVVPPGHTKGSLLQCAASDVVTIADSEVFHPRICGVDRTQYRAIRISPRTHFRPISASELSPGGGSESEFESEKDEAAIPIPSQVDAFEDPQADLKPLEEDAEKEGHYYGKLELESGKFLPRLKKSGMEKSAQTSLDSQEESAGILPGGKQNPCLECSMNDALEIDLESSEANCKIMAQCEEEINNFCSCKAGCQLPAYEDNPVSSGQLHEICGRGVLFVIGLTADSVLCALRCREAARILVSSSGIHGLVQERRPFCPADKGRGNQKALRSRCTGERNSGAKSNGFRRKMYSSASSNSEDTGSEGGGEWVDPSEEDLFSRTHL